MPSFLHLHSHTHKSNKNKSIDNHVHNNNSVSSINSINNDSTSNNYNNKTLKIHKPRTTSISSQQTTSSTNSYFSSSSNLSPTISNSETNNSTLNSIDEDIINEFSSMELPNDTELFEICKSNNIDELNNLELPILNNYISEDSIEKLDEGSSGSIIKVKSKSNKKNYVIKIFKSKQSLINSQSIISPNSSTFSNSSIYSINKINKSNNNKISTDSNNNYKNILPNLCNLNLNFNSKSSRSPIKAAIKSTSVLTLNKTISNSSFKTLKSNEIDGNDCKTNEDEPDDNKNKSIVRPMYTFDTLNEYLILSKLKSKYITPVYGLFKFENNENEDNKDANENENDNDNICIMLDFYKNSDLLRLITGIRKKNLNTSPVFKDIIFSNLYQD